MKLNPPASSSDLELARAVARRLHDRVRQPGQSEAPIAAPPPRTEPDAVTERPGGAKTPLEEPAVEVAFEPGPESVDPPVIETPEDDSALPPVDTPVFEPPEPEPTFEPPPVVEKPSAADAEQSPDYPFASNSSAPPPAEASPEVSAAAEEAWGRAPDDALSELTGPPVEPSLEDIETPAGVYDEASPAGVEDLVPGEHTLEAPESPFDGVGEPDDATAPGILPDAGPGPVPEASWDDVADTCLALAGAHGAMLVDTSAQVLTARGDWPEPGPDAIAGRLVSMMDRTLQDAPTRSVSAPIAAQHLTAWRIPASDGYFTVVFMGDAPLSADVRPDIDEHIRGALGG